MLSAHVEVSVSPLHCSLDIRSSAIRMSAKAVLYDRPSNMKFIRIGSDHKNAYRLFRLDLLANSSRYYDFHARWSFFDEALRDFFEMPQVQLWLPIIDCMQKSGVAYAFVPLNATSVTLNVSAMTIVSKKFNTLDHIYVCYMATKKEHRRQGLGTRLLQQIVQDGLKARQDGYKYVTMHVNTLNTVALELYERCGWRCFEYLPHYLAREPHHATNHAYALRLPLDAVRNATSLCRDPNAVVVDPSETEQSIRNCHRQPASM